MKTVIIDYGMGNLYSVKNAIESLGVECEISGSAEVISKAESLILPGVGAFPDAMKKLSESELDKLIVSLVREKKVPILGICLGMQLLLDFGNEFERTRGLGLIGGECVKIDAKGEKIPHIGWNDLVFDKPESYLLKNIKDGDYVYFVHSYRASLSSDENLTAHTVYGEVIPAIIENGNVFGAQFHPEKSADVGMGILSGFFDYCKEAKRIK